jgi:hypothetical protein
MDRTDIGGQQLKTSGKYRQTHSVCMSVSVAYLVNIFQLSVKYRRNHSACRDVGDCGIFSKYFATLY